MFATRGRASRGRYCELKSFARVELAPGESRTVTFRVPVAQLGFYDRELSYVVEPGAIQVFVGTIV